MAALQLLKRNAEERESERNKFTLEVTEQAPTATQMQNILDIIGDKRIGEVVPGAMGKGDAIKMADRQPEKVIRPIVVDWGNAKVVLGGNEKQIQTLVDGVY